MPPPNRRCRQLVVSGGYAAYDSSLPAKTTAATPDKMIVAAHLETYLATNWTEWVASCTAIEAAAGVLLAKNQYAYRTATLEAQGAVPEMLKQILTKAGGA
jgi:hypothetical protein